MGRHDAIKVLKLTYLIRVAKSRPRHTPATARRVLTPRVTAKSGLRSNPRAAPPRGIDGETYRYGPLSQRKGAKSRSALYDLRRIDYSPRRCAEGTTPHNMGYGPARPPHTRATRHLHAAGERVVR